jgi:hypothetical protein
MTEAGDLTCTPLRRVRSHRNRDKSGRYRWYCDYQLPDHYEGQQINGAAARHRRGRGAGSTAPRTSAPSRRAIPTSSAYPRRLDAESLPRAPWSDDFINTLLSSYTIAPTIDWLEDETDNRVQPARAS